MTKKKESKIKALDVYNSFSATTGVLLKYLEDPETAFPIIHSEKSDDKESVDMYAITVYKNDVEQGGHTASCLTTVFVYKTTTKEGKESFDLELQHSINGVQLFTLHSPVFLADDFAKIEELYKKQEAKGSKKPKDPLAKRKREEARNERIQKIVDSI